MATDIASKEPTQIRAGDTIEWKRSIDDYKASEGWTLKYAFRGSAGSIDITSSADGDEHLISVTPATSAAYSAGNYDVMGWAEKGSDRYTVFTSRIEVLVDLEAAGSSYDGRTHVKKTLDAIEAVLENRATKEIEESTIEGVMIKRINHEELIRFRQKYLSWYRQEQAAEKLKLGMGSGRTILTRFGK